MKISCIHGEKNSNIINLMQTLATYFLFEKRSNQKGLIFIKPPYKLPDTLIYI